MTKAQDSRAKPIHKLKQLDVLFVLLVGTLATIYHLVGDITFWGEWITIWPSVLWAVVFLPNMLWKRTWFAIALMVIFVLTITEIPVRWKAPPTANGEKIRIAIWNVCGNPDAISALRRYEPDIVLLQESSGPNNLWPGYHWIGSFDPGTLSRFPIKQLPTKKIGRWQEPQLLKLTLASGRKVLLCNVRLMLPGCVLQMVTPFDENPILNHRIRVEQYQRLAEIINETSSNMGIKSVILCGDFNVPANVRSLGPIRNILEDPWKTAGVGWGGTAPEFFPLVRIDQCWISKDISATRIEVLDVKGSDHRPILVDLVL